MTVAEKQCRDLAKEAAAATKGAVKFASLCPGIGRFPYAVGYRYPSVADRVLAAYVASVGHEPPDPCEQPGRFDQFSYSPRKGNAAEVMSRALYMPDCKHPPARLYAWHAFDGTCCVACCDCGAALAGAA